MALTKVTGQGIDNVTVDSSGNVGIGTNSPSQEMHLYAGSGATDFLIEQGSTGNAYLHTKNSNREYLIGTGSDVLKFYDLTADVERMRLTSGGNLNIGKTNDGIGNAGLALRGDVDIAQFTRSGGEPLELNRLSNDGALIIFYQDGTQEGNISVSGSTVSYNGGHLARWSQATDGNRINGLVKGTVMTNLDQMAVWTKDGVTEDNEQLNCMAVSSVEGDANVAGVFVNYDDDDTDFTADMNIAMTGDMVIRIASGTTVARGDLLMSAGDGTAKPQGDDIVRSKTIAKVTSITVSHTYDDGSYLVPCVLMAC